MTAFSKKGQAGFNLVFLMVLIAILSLTSVGTLNLGRLMARRSAEQQLINIGLEYQRAIKHYYETTPPGKQRYPATLGDLLADTRTPGTLRRHLRRIYLDPLTETYDWGLVRSPEGGIAGIYSLSNETPIKTKNFPKELLDLDNVKHYSDWIFSFNPNSKINNSHN